MIKVEGVDRVLIIGPQRLLGVGLLASDEIHGSAVATLTITRRNSECPLIQNQFHLRGGTISSLFEPEKFYTHLHRTHLIEVRCTELDPFVITVEPHQGVKIIAYLGEDESEEK